jgi:hypothetical protein
MPHLITIIKYACNIVKYILVFTHTIFRKGNGFVSRVVKLFFLFGLAGKMGSFGNSRKVAWGHGGSGLGQAGGLSYSEL